MEIPVSMQPIHDAIEDAGIPVVSVGQDGKIDFGPSVTNAQKRQAEAIFADIRGRPRARRENRKATRQALKALGNADTAKLLLELLVEKELSDPGWSARLKVEIWS